MRVQVILWVAIICLTITPLLVYFGKREGVSFWSACAAFNSRRGLDKYINPKFIKPIKAFFFIGITCYFVLLITRYGQS